MHEIGEKPPKGHAFLVFVFVSLFLFFREKIDLFAFKISSVCMWNVKGLAN